MKRMTAVILLVIVLLLPIGCGDSSGPVPPCAPEASPDVPVNQSAAVCMGSVSHPVHRIVQLGFMEKAEELGYEGHILGLDDALPQELYDCWLAGAKEYDIAGAVCWVGDDSAYDFLKELHGMGVKTVVPHFAHDYMETKDFIDVNLYYDSNALAETVADYLGKKLRNAGIQSGGIGVTVGNLSVSHEKEEAFQQYMANRYPEFTILDIAEEGMDRPDHSVANYIKDNPDIVAAFGTANTSVQAWAQAKEETGRGDIIVVGCEYILDSLYTLRSGKVDALVAIPLYEDGYTGMELIDHMLHGKNYSASESLWRYNLKPDLIYIGGQGMHDPHIYTDMYTRSKVRFGNSEKS